MFCNVDLKKWGLCDSELCSFCQKDLEKVSHLFFFCEHVKPLWKWLENLCTENGICITMNLTNVIFSHLHEDDEHIVNFVCTFIKQFVYKTRCLNDNIALNRLIGELECHHNIELAIAKEEMLSL